MKDYIEILKKETLEQFKGKPNVEALNRAIGRQLNDLMFFAEQLQNERGLYSSVGVQLDGIGDIAVLSRKEAGALLPSSVIQPEELDDETYRQRLLYKILKNTCDCVYADTRKVLEMFWKGTDVRLSERKDVPATIFLDFDAYSGLSYDQLEAPLIRAGGVGVSMNMHKDDQATLYVGIGLSREGEIEILCEVPEIPDAIYLTDAAGNILTTNKGEWLCL